MVNVFREQFGQLQFWWPDQRTNLFTFTPCFKKLTLIKLSQYKGRDPYLYSAESLEIKSIFPINIQELQHLKVKGSYRKRKKKVCIYISPFEWSLREACSLFHSSSYNWHPGCDHMAVEVSLLQCSKTDCSGNQHSEASWCSAPGAVGNRKWPSRQWQPCSMAKNSPRLLIWPSWELGEWARRAASQKVVFLWFRLAPR